MIKTYIDVSRRMMKAKDQYRDRIDSLRHRLNLLTGKDKILMTLYLEDGKSFRQIAQLAGVDETSIARRVYKLTERLIDGEYITCLRNSHKFTRTEMVVARDYFLMGLSIKKIATKYQCSYYRVSKTIKKIRWIVKEIQSKYEGV